MKIRDLAYWLTANKILDKPQFGPERGRNGRLVRKYGDGRILEEADRAIHSIRKGDLDPVDSAYRTVDYMRGRGLSNGTIRMTRDTICRFLLYSRLGLDPYDLRILVKNLPRVWVNFKRTPTHIERNAESRWPTVRDEDLQPTRVKPSRNYKTRD